jgi:hypothetical protein
MECADLLSRMCILLSYDSPGQKISLQCVNEYFDFFIFFLCIERRQISFTAVPLLYHRVLLQLRLFSCGTTFLISCWYHYVLRAISYRVTTVFTMRLSFCVRQDFAALLETDDNLWVTCSAHIVTVCVGCELLYSLPCKRISWPTLVFWTLRTAFVGKSPFSRMFYVTLWISMAAADDSCATLWDYWCVRY